MRRGTLGQPALAGQPRGWGRARPSPGRGTPLRAAPSLCPVNAIAPEGLPDGGELVLC